MLDRRTSSSLLPRGGADVAKLVMQQEYTRLQTAAGAAGGTDRLDERLFLSDFGDRIYIERIAAYAAQQGYTVTGATAEEREAHYRTVFDAMIADANYTFGGLTWKDRLTGNDAVESLFDAAYAYLVVRPSTEMYDPAVIRNMRGEGTLGLAIDAESLLPDAWKTYRNDHPDYASLDYRALLKNTSTTFGMPSLYQELARIETLEDAYERAGRGYISLSFTGMTDADLDRAIKLAGYTDLSGQQSLRDDVKRFLLIQAASQSQMSLRDLLQQEAVTNYHYGTEAERDALQIFLASEGEHASHIEEQFFSKLEKSDSRLRQMAKENRGAFFYHLVVADDTSVTIDAVLQPAFTKLRTSFWESLSTEEQNSLLANAPSYRAYFDLRSSQELITSGIFEKIEGELFASLNSSSAADADATLKAARANRSALLVAMIRSVQTGSVVTTDLPAQWQTSFGEAIEHTLADLDPTFLSMLKKETTLLDRFVDRYLETDATRNELAELLKGEPDLADFSSAHSENNALAQEALAEAQYTLLSRIESDARALSDIQLDYTIEQRIAGRLLSFARLL
jgi:hypothetical protein